MMHIIAVDDERPALRMLEKAIRQAEPDCSLHGFTTPGAALAHAKEQRVDVAFLDINMAGMNGLDLAQSLKAIYEKTNILFVTGYQEYALDAFSLAASGYIMKPAKPEAIAVELSRLRSPVQPLQHARVRIQCFGGFGVFARGKPLVFPKAKSRELLAYLAHKRGSAVSTADIAAALWDERFSDNSLQTQVRKARAGLVRILKDAGIDDILCIARNSIAIDVGKVECDYYDYLLDGEKYADTFHGEYLSEYSWAEPMQAYLQSKMT